jgi:lipoprotein-anchoring transpeptidase ErfK/SrfK
VTRRLPRAAALAAAALLAVPVAADAVQAPPAPKAPRLTRHKPSPAPDFAPTGKRAWTARVVVRTRLASAPRHRAQRGPFISPYAPYDGGPQTLLVLGAKGKRAARWYRVLLPSRPNGAAAWLPAWAVKVTATPIRIRVNLTSRVLELINAGRIIQTWTVAVGTTVNPTPTGHFAVSEIVPQPDPNGFFGPYIIALTAHSPGLSEFDGGDGRVALHGTSLPNLLGERVSHGCVRMPNVAAAYLAGVVPPGAPVDIVG